MWPWWRWTPLTRCPCFSKSPCMCSSQLGRSCSPSLDWSLRTLRYEGVGCVVWGGGVCGVRGWGIMCLGLSRVEYVIDGWSLSYRCISCQVSRYWASYMYWCMHTHTHTLPGPFEHEGHVSGCLAHDCCLWQPGGDHSGWDKDLRRSGAHTHIHKTFLV